MAGMIRRKEAGDDGLHLGGTVSSGTVRIFKREEPPSDRGYDKALRKMRDAVNRAFTSPDTGKDQEQGS